MNWTDFSGHRPVAFQTVPSQFGLGGYERTLRCLELFGLTGPSNTTGKPPERNDLLVFLDVAEVGIGLREFEALGKDEKLQVDRLQTSSITS
jgi:hypothetical protein